MQNRKISIFPRAYNCTNWKIPTACVRIDLHFVVFHMTSQLSESQHYVTVNWKPRWHLSRCACVLLSYSFTFVGAVVDNGTGSARTQTACCQLSLFLQQESLCAGNPKANQNKWVLQVYSLVSQMKARCDDQYRPAPKHNGPRKRTFFRASNVKNSKWFIVCRW
jgi:hypothetical protein